MYATQLHIETIVAPVGKSDPASDLQTDILFGGNGGAKINKFLDYVKSTVIGRSITNTLFCRHLLPHAHAFPAASSGV